MLTILPMIYRHPIQPHIRGKWRGKLPRPIYVYWPPFPTYPGGPAAEPRNAIINLPIGHNQRGINKKITAGRESPALLLPKKGRSRKCIIKRLPMEILLQIAQYLVPTDASFHVFPSTREPWGGSRSTILHKFSDAASEEGDQVKHDSHSHAREHLTALAQTCHVLSEAYYEAMYGHNHFIIELSSHEVYPAIEGPATPAVESWTKVMPSRRQGLWPLTEGSIPYVRHLTILGTLHWEETNLQRTAVRKHLLSAIRLLKQVQHIKSLTVDLRQLPRPSNPKIQPQMLPQMPFPPPDPLDLGSNRRLGWGVHGPQDTVLRLRNVITHDDFPGLVEFWSLFEDLRGFRDVVLSGHITAEMAEELRSKMMSKLEPLQSAKDKAELPAPCQPARRCTRGQAEAADPQKSGLKRKRGAESSKPLKSRRRA